mmetsp:Transcript_56133/g.119356  ORF Transcript_56133/g.119356 Transcript_56133/m.119356 type:complete len:226 (-) Transcript_56133:216-893(-)|eukprot:CAMPEP_0172535208 /NCGR_PEP_ID=MMETSP1067-20121228/7322_1 /TAXON_ID=265564 ORGANISM="Thalassiosira punctigera, Strain Tpunct2005C2" /NCGR_SAMPLE_ID=MMETSP1067 /ASSEMBLY_ACC=CAM_ASM_000444 /LENGTH=225 /DNA_ID=CAMNT_0013320123 /DNA_START=73 /DNA_END=750 /DNA_ORIENTATION=-
MALLPSLSRRVIVTTSRLRTPIGAKLSDIAWASSRQLTSATTGKKCVIVNAIGADRPGIVADVTRIVTARGGNVGESHSRLLGGHFSLMMLVEIPFAEAESLGEELKAEVGGMSTSCFDAVDPRRVEVCPKVGFAGKFKLSGADNPGIVHKLTSVLARNSLTIGSMKTSQDEAPFGGTELFTMEGRVVAYEPLTSNFDWSKIRAELQDMGESMNCDVEFDDVTGR